MGALSKFVHRALAGLVKLIAWSAQALYVTFLMIAKAWPATLAVTFKIMKLCLFPLGIVMLLILDR